jgi:hypothetical protein
VEKVKLVRELARKCQQNGFIDVAYCHTTENDYFPQRGSRSKKRFFMDWTKISNPCIGAVLALQIVEIGHMVRPCAESGAELARCNALPGQHTPEAPSPGNVTLFGPLATVNATVTPLGSIS